MQLVDANVLLYAVNPDAREHSVARGWVANALAGSEAIAFPWTVVLAFLRLSTHRAVFPSPLTPAQAMAITETWLSARPAVLIEPTKRHVALLGGILRSSGTAGNHVNDAHLAALALENGAAIVTFDRDFARFEGVDVLRPA